jgi:hypothetical protein
MSFPVRLGRRSSELRETAGYRRLSSRIWPGSGERTLARSRTGLGVSLGGHLAPRAAAFEKRISVLIANDGVYDYGVATSAGRSLPGRELR